MVYEKLKPLVTDKCPFVNLPETGRARLGRDFRRRENEEMRLGPSQNGSRGRIFGVDLRRQAAAFQIRGAPR
jgi:hypothetical protein